MNQLQVISNQNVLGNDFQIYGTFEEPMFLAKDVADWIEHNKPAEMISNVDHDEKLMAIISHSGQNRQMWFLTEDGMYEVLMQSRKPIAKQFKKQVKVILKEIRQTGQYTQKPLTTAEQIKLIAQGNSELDERLTAIEETIPLFPGEQKHIQKLAKRKAYEIMKNQFNGIPQGRISRKIFSAIYRSLYIAFNVPNYQSIPRGRYQAAVKFLETWQLPSEVGYQIEMDLESETA